MRLERSGAEVGLERGVLEALAAELRVPAEIFLEDSALDANSAML